MSGPVAQTLVDAALRNPQVQGQIHKTMISTVTEESKKFLFFIPLQVGPATPYARNLKNWMHGIIIFQAIVCALRFIILMQILGCAWMCVVCALGWYAWYHDMNITFVCCWGVACAVNCVMDIISLIIPFVWGMLTIQVIDTAIRVAIPFSELLGAGFAWHLYLDYEHTTNKESDSLLHSAPDPMAKFMNKAEGINPDEFKSLLGNPHATMPASHALDVTMPASGAALPEHMTQILPDIEAQPPPASGTPRRKALACC
jgi:hypothetical protein|mmetsp:Transcript_60077/g.176298  ORF Transcript_60077/g.176298 Transcript_60077/m.176298 type:complete len:258 (+) Transcript_60077:113-886(+)